MGTYNQGSKWSDGKRSRVRHTDRIRAVTELAIEDLERTIKMREYLIYALIKAAGGKIAVDYGVLRNLSPTEELWVTDDPSIPGRVYEVRRMDRPKSKPLKDIAGEMSAALNPLNEQLVEIAQVENRLVVAMENVQHDADRKGDEK